MNEQELIASTIARIAHAGQFRKDGATPYVTHSEAVAGMVSDKSKAAAWLHDVLEDCEGITTFTLRQCGIYESTVLAVSLLTKMGEEYDDYIAQICGNTIAREVKIADIMHNLSCNPTPQAIDKYAKALKILNPSTSTGEIM